MGICGIHKEFFQRHLMQQKKICHLSGLEQVPTPQGEDSSGNLPPLSNICPRYARWDIAQIPRRPQETERWYINHSKLQCTVSLLLLCSFIALPISLASPTISARDGKGLVNCVFQPCPTALYKVERACLRVVIGWEQGACGCKSLGTRLW